MTRAETIRKMLPATSVQIAAELAMPVDRINAALQTMRVWGQVRRSGKVFHGHERGRPAIVWEIARPNE